MSFGKLDRMVRFATTTRCRQQQVLDYFGEQASDPCGNCDNCSRFELSQDSGQRNTPALDETVLKILSGVARARGRFGKTIVSQMLSGSQSAKMARYGLNSLSTFGLLSQFRQTDVATIIDALVNVGLIELTEKHRYRPVVSITYSGLQVMKRNVPVPPISLPKELDRRFGLRPKLEVAEHRSEHQHQAVPDDAKTDDGNTQITETKLRVVDSCNESCNEKLSNTHPSRLAEGASDSGTDGRVDVADSAADIRNDKADQTLRPSGKSDAGAIVSSDRRPYHYWTWRLLRDGYTIGECVAIRGLDRASVVEHLARAVDEGRTVELSWVFSEPQLVAVQELVSRQGGMDIASLKSEMCNDFSYQEIQLFVKCQVRPTSAQQ